MNIGFEIGQKFRATFPKFPGEYIECRLLSTTIENDGQGTIKVETLKRSKDEINNQYFKPGENTMIIEELWFNVPDYRIIKIID